ncbi:MAG: DNA recombination protein RmuC, partial [Pseudomonadota bacterium]|nr:DNA recombination protein RmuC [Pseudomonadota bacterium]
NALFLGLLIGACFGLVVAVLALRLRARDTQDTAPDTDPMMEKITETVAQMARAQSELTGRLDGMAAAQETARGELTRTMTEQLTQVSKTVADNLKDTGERTTRTLGDLGQRLSLIDKAQQEITALSGQVVELQQILDNKQARGAFGEAQLADIVRDGLPETAYVFQHTLSNGRRADCLIRLPNPPGPVVVDSKFPLEAYQRWREAESDEAARAALAALRTDTQKHATDIAERYIIPGETADAALMFLPSESVFSELHSRLPDLVEKCRAMRVYPVSPNTMALTLNTVRAIMRDVKMREQAGLIQNEVRVLMEDVSRLNDRICKLRIHFGQAEKDIELIETSGRKITSRGERITGVELEDKTEDGEKNELNLPAPSDG